MKFKSARCQIKLLAVGFIKAAAGTKWISILPNMLSTQSLIASFDPQSLVCSVQTIGIKSYLRFGDEGPSRDGEAAVDCAEILGHDGETTPLSAARTGRQPLGKDDLEPQ